MNKKNAGGTPEKRAEAWTRYWQSGRRDSCSMGETGIQGARVSQLWRDWFSGLPEATSILDVGTGNGTLAILAREVSRSHEKSFRITGVDAANIQPDEQAAGIEFLGGVKAEALPFEDGRFGAIVGQYALEYSSIDQSIPEVARVLAPGGQVRFLIHSDDSEVIGNARDDLSALGELLDDFALIKRARRVFKARVTQPGKKSRKSLASTSVADSKLQQALDKLTTRIQQGNTGSHHTYFMNTFGEIQRRSGTSDPVQYIRFLDDLDEEMKSFRARLTQMIEAAKVEETFGDLVSCFVTSGITVQRQEKLTVGEHTLGWLLEGKKP